MVPPIFVRVTIVAVAVVAIVIGPVLLVSGVNVNSKSIVCFGFDGRESKQTERCQSQEEISFHIVVFLFRRMGIAFHAGLRLGSGWSLTIGTRGISVASHPSEVTDNDRRSSMRQQRIRFASFVKNRAEKSANDTFLF